MNATAASRAAVDWRQITHGAVLGLAGTALAILFKTRCGVVPTPADAFLQLCYSDVPGLWSLERLDVGAVPYLDHPVEYPPLTGLWMWLAAVGASNVGQFVVRTAGLLLVAGGAVGGLLAHAVGVRRTLVFAAAPTLVVTGAINWDLPSVALAVAGLVAHRRGRDGWAGVWLGLGTAAKLWPVLLVAPVGLAALALRGRAGLQRVAAGALGAWLAVNLPVLLAAPDGWLRFFALSSDRGPTLSSLWRVLPDLLGTQPSVATMNLVSALLTLAGIAIVLAVAVRHDPPEQWHLAGLPVVAVFLLAGKVYSPQFSLWLLPLLALAMPPVWTLGVFAAIDVAVNVTLFPHLGGVLGRTAPSPVGPLDVAVVARAIVLLLISVWGWRRAVRGARQRSPGAVA